MCQVLHVMCHVSCFTCHVSYVTCNLSSDTNVNSHGHKPSPIIHSRLVHSFWGGGQADTQTNTQTDKHINTITLPGLRAMQSEKEKNRVCQY